MKPTRLFLPLCLAILTSLSAHTQSINVEQKLKGIDVTITQILKDWNVPGCGVGIVVKDKLVFANGYGYRNLENKLPVTPNTLFQIASNTKLFTATAIGLLVTEGKLDWDLPVKKYIPGIEFYSDELTKSVTIRDMLSHRTGISRHDNIWYRSDFTRQELFDRLKYLEPSIPFRQGYLYNNLMYAAAGSVVEYLSGQTWEAFVTERLFKPLGMSHSMFVTEEMIRQPDFMTPYYEKRDSTILLPYPFYTRFQGVGPCGSIISSINDLSNWMIAQLHNGRFNNQQVIPVAVFRETLQPAGLSASVPDKYFENLNSMYGMGRSTSSYKGHYRVQHTGAIGGIYSIVSILPVDSIGIIVFTNGAHAGSLPGIIANTLYDKLLDLEVTPWSERNLKDYQKNKITDREARNKPDVDRVPDTRPSHPLKDFAGSFEDAAYGVVKIEERGGVLWFNYNTMMLPLHHYHYDRFVSEDDELNGKWSLLFTTDAQGTVQNIRTSMDEKEVVFVRKADARLSDPAFLKTLVGTYELNGNTISLIISNNQLIVAGSPPQHLDPYKGMTFRIREFSDQTVEFILDESNKPTGAKLTFDGKSVIYKKTK